MNLVIIEIKRNELVVATFRKRRSKLTFVEAVRHPIDQEGALPQLLAEFAASAPAERRVILAVPSNQLFMRELELPISDRRKIREILPLELKGETAVDTDQLVFEALPLDEGKVLALWAKRNALEDKIRILAEIGLEPEIITASLFNWQCLIPAEVETGTVAITDGESLAIFRNGKPLYFRTMAAGEPDAEVTKTLAALEIGRELTVDRIFSHGGRAQQAASSDASADLKTSTFPPIQVSGEFADAFAGDTNSASDLAGAYAVAHAIATGDPIDLRNGELAYTAGQAKTRKKLRLSMILAVSFVILLFAEVGLRYYLVKKDVDSLDNSIKTIYREVFPTRKKAVDEVAELRSEIKRLSSGKTSSNLLPILTKLAEAKGDDVFDVFEAEISGNEVHLKGDARSIQAVNDFKTRTADALNNVEVGETKSLPDGRISFVLRGTVREANK